MTMMAAEAGAGAAEAGAADASRGGRAALRGRRISGTVPPPAAARSSSPPRAGGRTQQGSRGGGPRPRTGGRTQQGRTRPSVSRSAPASAPRPAAQPSRPAGGISTAVSTAKVPASHQGIILAEFIGAVLLVAATPFARKDAPGVSPYVASDVVQLAALGVVYFILALVSGASPRAARFSAWFGALILLTVGLGEMARLAKFLNVFGLSAPSSPDTAPGQSG